MFSKIKENIEGYIQTRVELIKLDVEEQVIVALVKMARLLFIAVAATLFLLFLSIAIAEVINEVLESRFWGYLIIAFFYFVIAVILYFYKNYDQAFQLYFANKSKKKTDEKS